MPKLIIDNIQVDIPSGTNVLEAAKKAGIWIPHFCYHPDLGSVGACRLCAVKLLDGPVKGIQMSCTLPAQDGMVVSTTDPEALEMRKHVIEWLMINHPHDCPICDEGGECLLQDYTIAGGHGIRRFQVKKRTHINQYLGPHIEHEMNRCIQCYRCVRFYQDYAGGRDFGVMGSASRIYFGRFSEGDLESPFSGNLVDICPTGVFTDKASRFRARYWDYETAMSICPHCSLGCNTIPAARYRELLKVSAAHSDAVNGWFICDRGRFSNSEVNSPTRPRVPLVDGLPVEWDEALDAILIRVAEIGELYGPESLAVVGSSRLSQEGNLLLAKLAGLMDAGFLCFFMDSAEADRAVAAVDIITSGKGASQADVRSADLIAVLNCNPLEDGPMLALAIRQAWRQGARVYIVGENPSTGWLKDICIEADCGVSLAEIPITESKRPVIVCGTAEGDLSVIQKAADTGAKIAFTLNGPNAFGAALIAKNNDTVALDEAAASGKLKGIIAFEADIPSSILESVLFVAIADWRATVETASAQILLPTRAWVEMEGSYINNEGRDQMFKQVMKPGLPVKGADPAIHPSREHCKAPPGGDIRSASQVVCSLLERLGESLD